MRPQVKASIFRQGVDAGDVGGSQRRRAAELVADLRGKLGRLSRHVVLSLFRGKPGGAYVGWWVGVLPDCLTACIYACIDTSLYAYYSPFELAKALVDARGQSRDAL